MKFEEIEPNKTYYHHNKTVGSRGGGNGEHKKSHYVYRILKKDEVNKTVFGSCNLLPPKNYTSSYYKHWKKEMPADLKPEKVK